MKLRNDKEINAFFASAQQGVQLSQVHPLGGRRGYGRMPYPPTKTPTDCTDVHRLGATNAT